MMALLLLSVFSIYVLISGLYIIKRSILFGGIYFFLFLYSIFAQIGYYYYPELSEVMWQAYFGVHWFYNFYFFNFASFLSFFVLFLFLYNYIRRFTSYDVAFSKYPFLGVSFLIAYIFLFIFILIYYLNIKDILNYSSASDIDFAKSQGMSYTVFMIVFKFMKFISVIVYASARFGRKKSINITVNYKTLLLLFIFNTTLFLIISVKSGNRTDIVALILGILIIEHQIGLNFKRIISIGCFILGVLFLMNFIEENRSESSFELNFFQKLILQDYHAPAHILYAAMAYNYISPSTVLLSNVCNALILLDYPYLQAFVMELFRPGIATRSASYAFYLFSEGFIFMGYYGFIYNAIVSFIYISFWHQLKNSSNKYYNIILLSVMSMMFANIVRGQSSYFIKYFYTNFLFCFGLIYFLTGLKPTLFRTNKNIGTESVL